MSFNAGDNIQGVTGCPVSWEHFFHSLMLYHENLRRDLPNPDAVHYRHPPLRGITQRELEGLTSFFQLLTTIITWVCLSEVSIFWYFSHTLAWECCVNVNCLCIFLEWKCSPSIVWAPPVDPCGGDAGVASMQCSTCPESRAASLPGSIWQITWNRCFALAIIRVHTGWPFFLVT